MADGDTGTVRGDGSGQRVNADLLRNDIDSEADPLTVTMVKGYTEAADENGEHTTEQDVAAGVETYGSHGGVFTIEANGAWEFDPNSDFDDLSVGATRTTSVTVTTSDGTDTGTATLTVTVTGANDGPDGEGRQRQRDCRQGADGGRG